jgi:hypothetical protein
LQIRIILLLVLASVLLGCSEFDPIEMPGEYGWSWSREPDFTPRDVWSDGETIVVVGLYGRIRRFDGENWHEDKTGTTSHLYDLDGTSLDNLWAVGTDGTILQFDGSQWTAESSPSSIIFHRVDVGENGTVAVVGEHGRIVVKTGETWQKHVLDQNHQLTTVFVESDNSIWCSGRNVGLYHFDGTNSVQIEIPHSFPPTIYDIARHPDGTLYLLTRFKLYALRDDVWNTEYHVFGHRLRFRSDGGIEAFSRDMITLMTDDGIEHTVFDLPNINLIESVGEEEFVVVEQASTVKSGYMENWTQHGSTIWASSIREIVHLMDGRLLAGTSNGKLLIRDEETWSEPLQLFDAAVIDMAVDVHGDVFILGDNGTLLRWRETIENLGSIDGSYYSDYYAIHPLGDGRVIAVGFKGRVLITNGRSAEIIEPFTSQRLRDVWGTAPDNLFVVGTQEIWHWDGATWELELEDKHMSFYAVHGDAKGRVIATGWDGGQIYIRQTNGQWITHTESWDASLRHIAQTSGNAVYATGIDGGLVWIGDGKFSWIDPPIFNVYLYGIACDEESAAYIGTTNGGIYRYGR